MPPRGLALLTSTSQLPQLSGPGPPVARLALQTRSLPGRVPSRLSLKKQLPRNRAMSSRLERMMRMPVRSTRQVICGVGTTLRLSTNESSPRTAQVHFAFVSDAVVASGAFSER